MTNSLTLVEIPGIHPEPSLRSTYEAVFKHWHSVWGQTFNELDGKNLLHSDDFTRQDRIIALFQNTECVGAICYRVCDFATSATWKDSYFKIWPDEALAALSEAGPKLIIGSQISVAPSARQLQFHGFKLKTILSFCFLWQMERIRADAITGTMRADKGMNELFYSLGAAPLKTNQLSHGVPVDLVGFFPKRRPLTYPAGAKEFAEELWAQFEGRHLAHEKAC